MVPIGLCHSHGMSSMFPSLLGSGQMDHFTNSIGLTVERWTMEIVTLLSLVLTRLRLPAIHSTSQHVFRQLGRATEKKYSHGHYVVQALPSPHGFLHQPPIRHGRLSNAAERDPHAGAHWELLPLMRALQANDKKCVALTDTGEEHKALAHGRTLKEKAIE